MPHKRMACVSNDAFVAVEGEERLTEIPYRNRIFLDETIWMIH